MDLPQPDSPTRAVKLPMGISNSNPRSTGFFGLVAETQIPAADGEVIPQSFAAPGGFGQVQQAEDFVAGGHAVHGDVEERAQQPHGDEKVGGQQQNQQRPVQGDAAGGKLGSRQNRPQGRAAIGDEVHDGDGVELHGQHLHGDAPELLGLAVHLLLLVCVGLVDFQSGETLEVFQKAVTQGGVLAPVFGQQLFGPPLHRHNGGGDQGHADQQHQGRRQAHKGQHPEQGERGQHGVKELGQISAEIGFQLVHPFHRHLYHLGGVDLLLIGGAQPEQFAVDLFPQGLFHRFAGQVAHAAGQGGADKPHGQGCRPHRSQGSQAAGFHGVLPQPRQQTGYRRHQDNIGQQCQPLAEHVGCNVLFAVGHSADQPLVDHHAVSSFSLPGSLRRGRRFS